jgi:hypothetical protein
MSINAQTLVGGFKKYPLLVASALMTLVLLGVLYSRSGLIDAQQQELDKYLTEGSRHRANISNAAQLQEQLDFLIQANKAVRERALTAEGLAQNLQYFYRLESEVGIKYVDLRPGSRFSGKSSTYVPLNHIVNVRGSFTQIITFLRRLEQGVYFCRINTAFASRDGDFVTLNLNLDLLGVPSLSNIALLIAIPVGLAAAPASDIGSPQKRMVTVDLARTLLTTKQYEGGSDYIVQNDPFNPMKPVVDASATKRCWHASAIG